VAEFLFACVENGTAMYNPIDELPKRIKEVADRGPNERSLARCEKINPLRDES
jgi:hypothetical protein